MKALSLIKNLIRFFPFGIYSKRKPELLVLDNPRFASFFRSTESRSFLDGGWLMLRESSDLLPSSSLPQPTLRSLYNIHSGRSAVILGNGPSVRLKDFNRFHDCVTYACNKFYLSYPSHSLRPDYTLACDNQVLEDFGDQISRLSSGTKIFAIDEGLDYNAPPHVLWTKRVEFPVGNQVFHPFPFWGIPSMGSVVIMGIQLAFYMGCNPIYLYGVDHSFSYDLSVDTSDNWRMTTSEGNHFISDYRGGKAWCPPDIVRIEDGFKACLAYLQTQGVSIWNISRSTKLDCIPTQDIDSLS